MQIYFFPSIIQNDHLDVVFCPQAGKGLEFVIKIPLEHTHMHCACLRCSITTENESIKTRDEVFVSLADKHLLADPLDLLFPHGILEISAALKLELDDICEKLDIKRLGDTVIRTELVADVLSKRVFLG